MCAACPAPAVIRNSTWSRCASHYMPSVLVSHLEGLAGRRGRQPVDPSVNSGWQNQSFHNYADYSLQPEFAAALGRLLELGQRQRVAILCAEAVWWRCHRRIISDYLLAAGQVVLHIMGNHSEEARLTPFAHLSSKGCLTYPATNSN